MMRSSPGLSALNAAALLKGRGLFVTSLVVTGLIGGAWFAALYTPKQAQIAEARTELDNLTTQLSSARRAADEVKTLQVDVAALQVKHAALLKALPPTARVAGLLEELRLNVLTAGGTLSKITQLNAEAQGLPTGVSPMNFTLTLRGGFAELYQSLLSIESMKRFATIGSLSINVNSASDVDPQLGTDVALTVYTYDPTATPPKTEPGTTPPAPDAPPEGKE